ncbi:hypothetical protein [Polynucleobacter sp. P1-05-14]|uniref:hypothetical protein n=1 Tax=Polynucleobacter sp. P1-05-14 TaxID=1819732 RepID=UPI001C0E8CE3|nr:hypothetical protein [Polynucleobacter sp. P1-05-14]MBU3547845.1 hypothetical protein [Polynucleobacter sp. P1-05-14]
MKDLAIKLVRSPLDVVALVLISLNTILLAVWAVKDTIALRNIALVLGSILALIVISNDWRQGSLRKQLRFPNSVPLILLALIFIWVLAHFFFLSQDPIQQLQELHSTWLRALLGTIMAFGSGLVIGKRPGFINWLWFGLFVSILAAYFRYISRAIELHSLFAPDYEGYIFYGKIYAVLVGTILISGLSGTLLDKLRNQGLSKWMWQGLFWLSGLALVLYAYVFIFDARNGIGLAAILVLGLFAAGFIGLVRHGEKSRNTKGVKLIASFLVALLLLGGVFAYQQIKHNPGWTYLVEDAKIAAQIDRHPEWQLSNSSHIYPKTDAGRQVTGNNYERVAWAIVGLRLLWQNPFGEGLLYRSFRILLQKDYPGATPMATHSGWIDLSLAFGIPGIILMWSILESTFCLALRNKGPFMVTVLVLSLMLFLLYSVGELSNSHSLEILFYWFSMLASLQLPNSTEKNINIQLYDFK